MKKKLSRIAAMLLAVVMVISGIAIMPMADVNAADKPSFTVKTDIEEPSYSVLRLPAVRLNRRYAKKPLKRPSSPITSINGTKRILLPLSNPSP